MAQIDLDGARQRRLPAAIVIFGAMDANVAVRLGYSGVGLPSSLSFRPSFPSLPASVTPTSARKRHQKGFSQKPFVF